MSSKENGTWASIWSQPTSLSSVKNILRKYGLLRWIAARKPFLNERHVRSRLGWCKAYSKVEPSFWKYVIFSDEYRLELFGRKMEYVRGPKGTRFLDKYTSKSMKFGGASHMVWETIKEDRTKVPQGARISWMPIVTMMYWRKVYCKYMTAMTSFNKTILRATNPELYHLLWIITEYAT